MLDSYPEYMRREPAFSAARHLFRVAERLMNEEFSGASVRARQKKGNGADRGQHLALRGKPEIRKAPVILCNSAGECFELEG